MGISNVASNLRPGICTSSTRPTTPYEGQVIYETDTDKVMVYDGSVWTPPKNTAWGLLGRSILTSNFQTSGTHSTYQDNGASCSVSYGANRIIKATYKCMGIAVGSANDIYWKCLRGSTSIGEYAVPVGQAAAGSGYGYSVDFIFVSSSAATETFKMQIRGGNNTRVDEYVSGSMTTREFIVQDIGPA
jgi:hypothetical protein